MRESEKVSEREYKRMMRRLVLMCMRLCLSVSPLFWDALKSCLAWHKLSASFVECVEVSRFIVIEPHCSVEVDQGLGRVSQ